MRHLQIENIKGIRCWKLKDAADQCISLKTECSGQLSEFGMPNCVQPSATNAFLKAREVKSNNPSFIWPIKKRNAPKASYLFIVKTMECKIWAFSCKYSSDSHLLQHLRQYCKVRKKEREFSRYIHIGIFVPTWEQFYNTCRKAYNRYILIG